jgi:hypothetical protein
VRSPGSEPPAEQGAPIDREVSRELRLEREPRASRQRHVEAADADRPRTGDGLEIGEHLHEPIVAERTVEEEDGADQDEAGEPHGIPLYARDARPDQTQREIARGAREARLEPATREETSEDESWPPRGNLLSPHARATPTAYAICRHAGV